MNDTHVSGGAYRGRAHQHPDTGCASWQCRGDVAEDAPVPLCARHMRRAFAYVMERDQPDLSERLEAADADRVYWNPTPKAPGFVYFVRLGDLVKIGYTSKPKNRMSALQPTEILHMQPGTMQDEKRCHLAFAHLRVEGELFRPEPDLLRFIDDLRRQAAA